MANDENKKLLELLSLRMGLRFPRSVEKPNPPFVAGINSVWRREAFYKKIEALPHASAMTKVGQMNLGAVFPETVCCLVKPGTTIVCIFPKAHLTARGIESVIFRNFLLDVFGLHTIFNYPAEDIIKAYIPLQRAAEKQQRAFKSQVQWMNVLKNETRYEFPANTVLIPTKIRRNGRVFLSRIPLFVSTNFATFTYDSDREA